MKKILYSTLFVAGLFNLTSCDDFLETSSPSVVDADFVFSFDETANAAMVGIYDKWRSACQTQFFGDGVFYAADVAGSDIERHPEKFSAQPARHYPESFYQNGTYTSQYNLLSYISESNSPYAVGFAIIGPANSVVNAAGATADVQKALETGEPNTASQLWGEAICARSVAYREIIRYSGDLPLVLDASNVNNKLVSRYAIYDQLIADLQKAIPVMYRVGENSNMTKNKFSRTFAEGLLGRICMDAAGYQTRRTDNGVDYVYGDGTAVQFEDMGKANGTAKYGRPDRWKQYAETARDAFKALIANSGSAKFLTVDPRGEVGKDGKTYGNPYQYFFQQMNDLEYADESIYEYAMSHGTGNDARPYSFGRPSSGGGSNAFPCKSYGQGRINPAYYWGMFDPKDMRRDVSICITGSTGKGGEKLIPFTPGSKSDGGGLTLNKWDECRMSSPYLLKQRLSGINGPYMRMADIYLSYAEACAMTGDEATAKQYLAAVRERSFPAGKANTDQFISSCGSVLRAVIEERGFEFAGEGDRRWTLIRTGYVGDAIKNIKEMTKAMLDGLKENGYYTFENGNQISSYVWTKEVDGKEAVGHRLTTQCPADKEDDPVLYPGWRGQNDDWAKIGMEVGVTEANITKGLTAGDKTNLAIKGLFKYIDPEGDDAAALEADGYAKVAYGKTLVDNYDEYYTYLFVDYDYESAPIYLWPLTPNTVSTSAGLITNGYGFKQE